MKIKKHTRSIKSSATIVAADGDMEERMDEPVDESDLEGTIDDISDNLDDLQDTIDDIEEDDVDIEMDNNIGNHFIAECDRCHGVFISALVESDQQVEKISGTCPLCDKETDQYLKWVIKDV